MPHWRDLFHIQLNFKFHWISTSQVIAGFFPSTESNGSERSNFRQWRHFVTSLPSSDRRSELSMFNHYTLTSFTVGNHQFNLPRCPTDSGKVGRIVLWRDHPGGGISQVYISPTKLYTQLTNQALGSTPRPSKSLRTTVVWLTSMSWGSQCCFLKWLGVGVILCFWQKKS